MQVTDAHGLREVQVRAQRTHQVGLTEHGALGDFTHQQLHNHQQLRRLWTKNQTTIEMNERDSYFESYYCEMKCREAVFQTLALFAFGRHAISNKHSQTNNKHQQARANERTACRKPSAVTVGALRSASVRWVSALL